MSYPNSENNPQNQIQPEKPVHPLANYQFSPDELRTLRECDMESFVRRSLPLGTAFGVAAYMGVQKGMLKPSARFGAGPKVVIGAILGYFVGKFSYQNECAEKIMKLPNSKLAEMLKMRKRGGLAETFLPDQGYGSALSMTPFQSATDHYSDVTGKSTSLNLDTERPANSGLDDIHRPNVDGPATTFDDDLKLPSGPSTSYDELRQRNRESYSKKQSNPYYRPIEGDQPPVIRGPPKVVEDEPTVRKSKNRYGDDWAS